MSALSQGMVDRRILEVLRQRTADEPVIALHGPRSVGKSTLLRAFASSHGGAIIDLDDPSVLDAVSASPALAVSGSAPVCIDEYQRALELLDALKARLNREGSLAGTAVLTGSTRHDAVPRTVQALTGRLHVLTILPLSQGEIDGCRENLIESLLVDPLATVGAHPASSTTREEYVQRVCAGGFPLALRRSGSARSRWFADYVTASIERDAVEIGKIRQREVLRQLLDRLAGQTAQVLNVAAACSGLSATRVTVDSYVRLLEDLFLVHRLPAWGKTLRSRAAKTPKIHVVDSGLAAWLLGSNSELLATLDPSALSEFGHLLETFVVGELRKQVSWLDMSARVGHWRVGSNEVDVVLEFDDGRIIAFEIKASQRIRGADLSGLAKLRDLVGDRFIAGVALSTGSRSYSTDEDRLHVMPVDRIWLPI